MGYEFGKVMLCDDLTGGGILVGKGDERLFASSVLSDHQLLLLANLWLLCPFGKFDPGTFAEVDVEKNAFRK